jgi:hypothetical protein
MKTEKVGVMMEQGMLHRLIAVFMDISRSFRKGCDCKGIEDLAILVHAIMSRRTRQFHTLEHVFGFIDGSDHLVSLAAVFHDLVYYQVDNGLPAELSSLLNAYVTVEAEGIQVRKDLPADDRAFRALCAVFNIHPGNILKPASGLNEFLSALAMLQLMSPYLDFEQLVALLVCIEASIPFRGSDADGYSVGEILEQRLEGMRKSGLLVSDADTIQTMVHRAVLFANADVRDFSLPDAGHFLSNTWKLLPESNAALRHTNIYTIRDYRKALVGMRGFLASLSPEIIYHTYRGDPAAGTMAALYSSAGRNLRCAMDYFEAKILAIGLLDAMACLSGGDVPVALFMGELPAEEMVGDHFIDFLPGVPVPDWLDEEDTVYRLLKDGRLDESSFDLRNSPLAMHLYLRLGPDSWKKCCAAAIAYVDGTLGAKAFLNHLPKALLSDLLEASANMVPTRRSILEGMIEDLQVSA